MLGWINQLENRIAPPAPAHRRTPCHPPPPVGSCRAAPPVHARPPTCSSSPCRSSPRALSELALRAEGGVDGLFVRMPHLPVAAVLELLMVLPE
ncbi:unnamed protein product [Urochloa humidicola]